MIDVLLTFAGPFGGDGLWFVVFVVLLLVVFAGFGVFASRFKRCPPNRILVK